MNQFIQDITPTFITLFWICEFNVLYYMLLTIVGFFSGKIDYPMIDDKLKFCIFVPCHNEGGVIKATVKNHSLIEYDPNLFDVYFIADNCSDNTEQFINEAIAECGRKNFHCLVRHDPDLKKRGKPHALKWAIDTLESRTHFYSYYNMTIILDADNFTDSGLLKHMNSQYYSYKENDRPVMIQAYLDSKNKQFIVARGYFITYRVMNRFWQMSKQKLHLVPGIGGTGFAIDNNFLHELGGFNCTSLTEDLEIETLATIRNKKIAYNAHVRLYDEKPTKLKASFVQRIRWAQGHWFCFFKFFPRLFIQLFNPKTIKNFFKKIDVLVYLSSRLFVLISLVSFILGAVITIYGWCVGHNYEIVTGPIVYVNIAFAVLSVVIIPLSCAIDGTKEEKKHVIRDAIPNILAMYFISIVDMIVGIIGLIKCPNQKVWKKTTHSINTVSSDIKVDTKNTSTKN